MPKVLGIPTVRFNLANVRQKLATVILVFRYDRKLLRYSPGVRVDPKYWDKRKQRAKFTANHPEYVEDNQYLNKVEEVVYDIYRETKGAVSVEEFKREILYRTGKAERPTEEQPIPTLVEYAPIFVDRAKSRPDAKPNYWKGYHTAANHLAAFVAETGYDTSFDKMDIGFFEAFKNWLFEPPRTLSINSVSYVFKRLRRIAADATERYNLGTNNFEKFRVTLVKTEKEFALTPQELAAIRQLDLSDNKRLEKVRDLFLIGCLTALRWSDLSKLSKRHLIAVDGGTVIEKPTIKGHGKKVYIPVEPELLELLQKYEYKLPKISNQKFNQFIKEVATLAGVTGSVIYIDTKGGKIIEMEGKKNELIGSHCCRRTYLTIKFKMGIPAAKLMMVSGHATEKQFMDYIKIDGKRNALELAKQIGRSVD